MSDAFVENLYRGVLKRPGDDVGFRHNTEALGSSPTFNDAANLLAAFVASDEARSCRVWHGTAAPAQPAVKSVMSIGTHCLSSFTLKKFELKMNSGPFDWIFSSLPMVRHCIENDFSIFLDRNYIKPIPEEARSDPGANCCDHLFYRDKFGVHSVFNHYDPTGDEAFSYYVRCVERFRTALHSHHRTLLVGVVPAADDDGFDADFDALCDTILKYPSTEILLVRAVKSDWTNFGANLIRERSANRMFNLHMTGELGPVEFTHSADEAAFRRILDNYSFELAPGQ